MLTVLPIQSKDEQKELCSVCGIEFIEDAFAYRADDGGFIGICQFSFKNNCGYIHNLSYAPNVIDNEAMIIMLRATMSFMFRCGLVDSYIQKESTTETLLRISGYKLNNEGKYYMNLDKFYNTPCSHWLWRLLDMSALFAIRFMMKTLKPVQIVDTVK